MVSRKLVIVESPTKAKTLTKILGSRYGVKSSAVSYTHQKLPTIYSV